MSAADVAPAVPSPGAPTSLPGRAPGQQLGRPVRGWALRFLGSELRLIFGRRRNLAGLGVLAVVPVIMAVVVKMSQPESGGGPDFLSSITDNGLFVALAALGVELGLFLPLAVGTIAGDSVAGEANIGTLRYLLAVPVDRTRLLAVKYAAIVVFSLAATLLVTLVGSVVGVAIFGAGDMTLLSGSQVGFADAAFRVLLATVYLALCFASLGAIGLFVSTLTEQPIGATIAVVIINVLSFILDAIPQLAWLHEWLPTHWWMSFGEVLRDPIAWDTLGRGVLTACCYALVFWLAAWARFAGKDVTS